MYGCRSIHCSKWRDVVWIYIIDCLRRFMSRTPDVMFRTSTRAENRVIRHEFVAIIIEIYTMARPSLSTLGNPFHVRIYSPRSQYSCQPSLPTCPDIHIDALCRSSSTNTWLLLLVASRWTHALLTACKLAVPLQHGLPDRDCIAIG